MPAFSLSYEDQHGAIEITGEQVPRWGSHVWELKTAIDGCEHSTEAYRIAPMRAAVGIIERVRRHQGHSMPAMPHKPIAHRRSRA
jgi:hypothetical protein